MSASDPASPQNPKRGRGPGRGRYQANGWSPAQIRALGTLTNIETAGSIFGLTRGAAYRLAANGDFPVPLVRVRTQYRVPVAEILRALCLAVHDEDPDP
ncbi:hypothetical protein GCM10010124_36760 [Pilimelia terevasa]|uniref:Helix-turn-helix domain-containing protein n=1 Tax=Pilimelia terevasa TaxID=53372 RepID=A0A8J3FJW5_9ACTN|nr:DNA-binding protein [Pilimelia terevasa]GGK40609.1 hypothetical protein GCM10010124_36760 [Pilimelia terevasa]